MKALKTYNDSAINKANIFCQICSILRVRTSGRPVYWDGELLVNPNVLGFFLANEHSG